ncbi:serine/threonine-protein kinase CDG1-like isoform X2 [Salvia miltiorrhiza]|uniref:serine/threonine-protein kinase CDG1-like isoform X2 n=1 Tax=Salvia miltiorrhiza TaxID=226208 RepID=UPI0025AD4913|nr:serine/threonine-protein kinase CDG1-like isoform X2 [Salvia miltiorrhiza]
MPSVMGSRSNSNRNNRILFVCDATKDRSSHEFRHSIHNVRMQATKIVNSGDTIVVLGALHRILHPMGYSMEVVPENFLGTTHTRAKEEHVSKKVDLYVNMLQRSAEECEAEGVDIQVKVTAGTPMRKVVLQEAAISEPTWVILDRHLRKDLRFYLRHIPCKVALVLDNLSVEVLRPYSSNKAIEYVEDKLFYSLSKPVPLLPIHDNENNEQSVISFSYHASMYSLESSDMAKNLVPSLASNSKEHRSSSRDDFGSNPRLEKSVIPQQLPKSTSQKSSNGPAMCMTCGLRTEFKSMRYSYSEIQLATDDFSSDNLLGEGGFGPVYLGRLKDGQRIAAKVQREASSIGSAEFHSEVYVLSFARHKNIVMLLGHCSKEDLNILVYEYICNKSLNWHLFESTEHVLEWHQRYTIAIGIAKGLRFLHEECRGSPIIHRDVRPGNIMLTHDFVPMLGDFGFAKWKTDGDDEQTRILGSLGYLAPEYAENGIVSVRTDVYAFGIVLIQLISGRRPVDLDRDGQQLPLRHWALPLIETLSLRELSDPRLEDSCNTCELYHMARTAYACIQTEPQMRPSMAEALSLLEGENDHLHLLTDQLIHTSLQQIAGV